jgi:hypothetical protein
VKSVSEFGSLSALSTVVLLSLSLGACGNIFKNVRPVTRTSAHDASPVATNATSATSAVPIHPKSDIDGDNDNNEDDYGYGHAASPAATQAITTLVKRYYTAAAAANGAEACLLMYSLLAEEIPEEYGEPPGQPALRGSTCAVVMSKIFNQQHNRLVAELPELEVAAVRVRSHHALVILGFHRMPPREIRVHLEYGVWKIDELLDNSIG